MFRGFCPHPLIAVLLAETPKIVHGRDDPRKSCRSSVNDEVLDYGDAKLVKLKLDSPSEKSKLVVKTPEKPEFPNLTDNRPLHLSNYMYDGSIKGFVNGSGINKKKFES